jgi:hypothetical protein
LWLNEHKGPFLDEKPKKLVNMEGCSCTIVAKVVRKLKRWLLIIKIVKHDHKWQILGCNCKLDGYVIQDFF